MKIRVKVGSESRVINFEDKNASSITLRELEQATATQFHLENQDFHLSLNKRDPLSGHDQPLAEFGVVSGDLLHIIGPGLQVSPARSEEQVQNRIQGLASHSPQVTQNGQHTPSTSGDPASNSEPLKPGSTSTDRVESDMDVSGTKPTGSASAITGGSDSDINRFLQEPLVVRESTGQQVPVLLSQIYLSASCNSYNDALWVVLHTLMLESGFLPPEKEDPTAMPKDWKKSGYYSCVYDYPVSNDIVMKCSLVGVTVGASIAVHGLSQGDTDIKTEHLQLKSTDFVRTLSQDVPETYRALDRLSRQFKDTICLPLVNEMVIAAGFSQREGLLALPYETKIRIMSFLDAKSLVQVGQTCQQFSAIYRDKTVWRILYIRAFGRPDDCSLARDWYELFKVQYQRWKDEQASRRRIFHLDEFDPSRFPRIFPGPPSILPGTPYPHFLGGDYDINPEFSSGIPNPLGGGMPQGPRLPNIGVPDPFSPGLGGPRLPGRSQPGRGNLTGSPFSSGIRGPFNFL